MNEINEVRKGYIILFLFVLILIGGALYLVKVYVSDGITFLASIFIILSLGILLIKGIFSAYRDDYYKKVLKPTLKKYGIEYIPYQGLDEVVALSSGLLPSYDIYRSEDYIQGNSFEAAKIILKVIEETRDSEGNVKRSEKVVFNGTLLVFYSDRQVVEPFIITNASFHLSDILPFLVDKDRKKLDDPEFEKYFDVYGGDDIEVRKFLTHDIMKKLVELKKEIGFNEISFVDILRFVSFIRMSPVIYPNIFVKVTEKVVLKSISNALKIKKVADFFQESRL